MNYIKAKQLFKDLYLWATGRKYSLIRRRRNVKKEPLKLFYWHDHGAGIYNFGDEMTKDLILSLFGYQTELSPLEQADLAGAGSVVEMMASVKRDKAAYMWGSGFIKPPSHTDSYDFSKLEFTAVRGKITRNRLGISKNIPIGDPGLLANLVYDRASVMDHKIGVVAHFVDADLPIIKKVKKDPRFKVISPLNKPSKVAKDISSCDLVLSSSLHGLVFSDSFNVPNYHISLSSNVVGGEYKFRDYYSATGRNYSPADVSRIFDDAYLTKLKNGYKPVVNLSGIQKKLIKAFPYK